MILKESFVKILNNNINTNNKYNKYIDNLPNNFSELSNIILYGPCGIGKYSEALKIIVKYSDSKLKYEKKMIINSLKNEHYIKISDIHYEINLENLTCNSKLLFNDIYNNIVDCIESSNKKQGIILFKNFHLINNEILENLYSYMQKNLFNNIVLKFIILTEHLSFINSNIIDICSILYYSKLSYNIYNKMASIENKKYINKNTINLEIDNINILKHISIYDTENMENIKNINTSICKKIINIITNSITTINYINIRNILYDLLIYNLNIYNSIYYILENIILIKINNNKKLNITTNKKFINNLLTNTLNFFKLYNNNYRPIYHLENYILYIIKEFNEY